MSKEIFEKAQAAAIEARDDSAAKYGNGYPCGFAWINIKPARGKFIAYCKANNIGRKGVYGGYTISDHAFAPWMGQNMNVKEDIAQAVAKVLRAEGINAYAQSRID